MKLRQNKQFNANIPNPFCNFVALCVLTIHTKFHQVRLKLMEKKGLK